MYNWREHEDQLCSLLVSGPSDSTMAGSKFRASKEEVEFQEKKQGNGREARSARPGPVGAGPACPFGVQLGALFIPAGSAG